MKRALAFLLLALMALNLFKGASVIVWFEVNQAYIAANLCENRFKPVSRCEGSCVLMQKMTEVNPSAEESAPVPAELPDEQSFSYLPPSGIHFDLSGQNTLCSHPFFILMNYRKLWQFSFFHPPEA
ncbi:MAG: hypothetical protein MI784_06110 [Cytophagales bacterium]|nr:hypothetical protein [Cytophagales bacterium]